MNKKVIEVLNDCKNLEFEINNEVLVVNFFCDNLKSMDISIIQNENSEFILNFAAINNSEDVNIHVNALTIGNNNKLVLNTRCINMDGNVYVDIKSKVKENTKNNVIIEDAKGLIEKGGISFLPILEIDTKEVDASHYATIGKISKDELFYLQTKGISEINAKNMLKKAFLYNMFSTEFQNKIRKD